LRRVVAAVCALAIAWPAAPAAQAQNRLPALGDTASEDFNLGTERRIGDQIMREIRRDTAYSDDPVLLEYLQSVFLPLVSAARRRGEIGPDVDTRFAWEAFLVRDRSVNAFALPGGYIGVHLGLIAMTSTRDELAAVLAHELSHVTQRHIARSISNSRRQSLIGVAATILGILAASRSNNADVANAAIAGGQAATIQGQLNFSRDMEREADRIGPIASASGS
jgi:beta-barrel assembly-enhancing protease